MKDKPAEWHIIQVECIHCSMSSNPTLVGKKFATLEEVEEFIRDSYPFPDNNGSRTEIFAYDPVSGRTVDW